MFPVSPRSEEYFLSVSQVSSPCALSTSGSPAPGSLLNEVTGSYNSTVGSPITSLSITNYAVDLTLLLEPLIPLPDAMLLQSVPALMLPHTYPGCQPPHAPVPLVDQPPVVLSCEGPFDAFTEPDDTRDHPCCPC